MAEVTETLLQKKLEGRRSYRFGNEVDNFVEPNEITVTITLSEYRDLVERNATSEARIKDANEDKYTRDNENSKLKEKVKELETVIFEYRKQFGELVKEEEE